MSRVKVFIIEDDFIHANRLEMYLSEMGYDLAGISKDAEKAIEMINDTQPDLLLVDIHLSGDLDGVQMVEQLQNKKAIPTIFITSYRDKDTFERAKLTDPYAYILKPYDKETLQNAIDLAIYKFSKRSSNTQDDTSYKGWFDDQFIKEELFVKTNKKLIKIKLNEVLCIESKDKICLISVGNKVIETRITLTKLEDKLISNHFIRIHRSFIINKNKISQVDLSKNEVHVGGFQVPIGRAYKEAFIKHLSPFLD
ncbi:LytR/AlgR family response regulator transcription factor [Chondrinema litorale]|uniref:LytR/AlgR family response regulator transcription factor n=1 Tax=Chondrinema litorale TaxID=2994555 RepID=UPI00254340D0|nr:LytTR family transcriptional regulator DNA-binding domain-containing protein [Chondrinema litorale]UZR96350.1 LytTR family transcriptional regulator DNA-binding domain-containing protein [Chondrinema litorale]